jgi:hypothetical protein
MEQALDPLEQALGHPLLEGPLLVLYEGQAKVSVTYGRVNVVMSHHSKY